MNIGVEIKGLNEVNRDIAMMKRIIPDEATKGLFDVAVAIRNNAIISMQNTARRSDRVYRRGAISHRPSSPGWPPAIDTGVLVGSLLPEILPDNSVRMGSLITSPPYPEFLEEGTRKMDARPWLKPAIETTESDIEDGVLNRIIVGIERL